MTREEFVETMARFRKHDVVKTSESPSPGEYHLQLWSDLAKKERTQRVHVELSKDAKKVLVYSPIGACPDDAETLRSLLAENLAGQYSRLARLDEKLVQLFRYDLAELGSAELAKAIDEVSRMGDAVERKYFGRDIA